MTYSSNWLLFHDTDLQTIRIDGDDRLLKRRSELAEENVLVEVIEVIQVEADLNRILKEHNRSTIAQVIHRIQLIGVLLALLVVGKELSSLSELGVVRRRRRVDNVVDNIVTIVVALQIIVLIHHISSNKVIKNLRIVDTAVVEKRIITSLLIVNVKSVRLHIFQPFLFSLILAVLAFYKIIVH